MIFTHPTGTFNADITQLTIAGWTGRDAAAVAHHIEELAAIGVAPPSQTPLFYRASNTLLVQTEAVQVVGGDTSGETEPLLLRHAGVLWLGLGSDHTDRAMETASVAASKQACPKPCASAVWLFDDVQDHIDDLQLRSWIKEGGNWVMYQDGTLAHILPLQTLLDQHPLGEGHAMLCGTLGAIGGVRPAADFRAELRDPVLGRSILMEYQITTLSVVS